MSVIGAPKDMGAPLEPIELPVAALQRVDPSGAA